MTVISVVQRLRDLTRRVAKEDGQALVEYALLVSLIALVAFTAVEAFGVGVSTMFSKIVDVVP